jgi:hypothetical protein
MVFHFNDKSWRDLTPLRVVAAEFHRSNETSQRFLATAAKLDDDVISRLARKAQEARLFADQVMDPMAKLLLQQLADSYERLGR